MEIYNVAQGPSRTNPSPKPRSIIVHRERGRPNLDFRHSTSPSCPRPILRGRIEISLLIDGPGRIQQKLPPLPQMETELYGLLRGDGLGSSGKMRGLSD
jgi:hypothetical protein